MTDVTEMESLLKKCKWGDLSLRPYQLEGVVWLMGCYDNNHGCILSDEMGLGKTCQVIAMLTVLKKNAGRGQPHLIVCPRSVLENWQVEFQRFSPSLKTILYIGDKETRLQIASTIESSKTGTTFNFDVLLTTYEMCLKDSQFLSTISWDTMVVDEGHRLKNSNSLLYTTLEMWSVHVHILLTGTPIQNNLQELYALLSFVDSSKFNISKQDKFLDQFSAESKDLNELHVLLAPYILRRTKANVLVDLPEKKDVVLYHGLSALQKKLYKAILTKDLSAFDSNNGGNQPRLMNILMQLRKCVNHPYLFQGVEPEPFKLGEHLVEASHKLVLIDHLLAFLKPRGHKVLLFSQMSRMLDILQDYLGYRGYTYERLDGSIRGEERFLAVQNFNKNDETFVFLLSTKAGGQGLNLTAADTVILVDSDFNPQNDLQAAARAHRLGQDRPVKIIRLVGRHTVEEIILRRAEDKLRLTDRVIESGHFTFSSQNPAFQTAGQLQEILKFGVEALLAEAKPDDPLDFELMLGQSMKGRWVQESLDTSKCEDGAAVQGSSTSPSPDKADLQTDQSQHSMYVFEGTDYSKKPSSADMQAFEQLVLTAEINALENAMKEERVLRKPGQTAMSLPLPEIERRPKRQLTEEELEERRQKRQEAAQRRAALALEQQAAEEEAKRRNKAALWQAHQYTSTSIVLDREEEDEKQEEIESVPLGNDSDSSDDDGTPDCRLQHPRKLNYVIGDVTHPLDGSTSDNIIVHCVDDSGVWGRGGLFSAISNRSSTPEIMYELAGKMKDLKLGDCHLMPIDNIENREDGHDLLALVVAQHRDRSSNKLSGIQLSALETGLLKVLKVASERKASVHLPRIGHDTPGFNWYGTERLLQRYLVGRGVPTFIYYFSRKNSQKRTQTATLKIPLKAQKLTENTSPTSSRSAVMSSNVSPSSSRSAVRSSRPSLLNLFSGLTICFHNIPEVEQKRLKRFVIAYDGDVEKQFSYSTTHLVTTANTNKQELNELVENVQCCVVTSDWLDDCVQQGKLLATQNYLISLA